MIYTELDVWKKSRELVLRIYRLTENFPVDEKFGITSQMRRSVVSIPSNIAEGCGRRSLKEATRFLFIARGSLYELETQTYLSLDLEFIDTRQTATIMEQIEACRKLLNGFIKYHKEQITTGKFEEEPPGYSQHKTQNTKL